ncbi:hypothetical protein TYRP_017991 [Tyrophagus putrescentiae]|nr:hypothetical protein TYRP_017991 [Tyrophagus putrescentiae]
MKRQRPRGNLSSNSDLSVGDTQLVKAPEKDAKDAAAGDDDDERMKEANMEEPTSQPNRGNTSNTWC